MKIVELIGAAVIAGLLAIVAGFYIASLHSELETANTRLGQAEKGITDRDSIIQQLRDNAVAHALAQTRLEGERNGIRTALETRENLIRKLEIENAEYRTWAAAPVPGTVGRLREHGAIVGAAAYRERMSSSTAMPPAGSGGGK